MHGNAAPLQGHSMDESAIDTVLRENGVGILSLASDGTPYSIPMSFGYGGDDQLYFLLVGHSEEGRKVRYAEETTEASFLVYNVAGDSQWESVIVSGPLERITYDEWETARTALADNAYRPELLTDVDVTQDPRVWTIDITAKSGRAIGSDG